MRLYAGKFAGGDHEARIREWCSAQIVGSGPIQVVGAEDVVAMVRGVAGSKSYRDNAVLPTMKVLDAVGGLAPLGKSGLVGTPTHDVRPGRLVRVYARADGRAQRVKTQQETAA